MVGEGNGKTKKAERLTLRLVPQRHLPQRDDLLREHRIEDQAGRDRHQHEVVVDAHPVIAVRRPTQMIMPPIDFLGVPVVLRQAVAVLPAVMNRPMAYHRAVHGSAHVVVMRRRRRGVMIVVVMIVILRQSHGRAQERRSENADDKFPHAFRRASRRVLCLKDAPPLSIAELPRQEYDERIMRDCILARASFFARMVA